MIEEVNFTDTDMFVNIQIDNESKELPIKEIIKLPTFIELNQSLDTAYLNDIVVDLSLYYIIGGEVKPLNIDGILTIKLCKENENLYSEFVNFKKGKASFSIPNNFPIDEYKLLIQYYGNKYFQFTYHFYTFSINKRQASCTFDSDIKNAYPKEDIIFNGTLIDTETKRPLNNVNVFFNFYGVKYATTTKQNGTFSVHVTLPDADISHCVLFMNENDFSPIEHGMEYLPNSDEQYIDEDGNIRTKEKLYESVVQFRDIEATYDNYEPSNVNISKTTYPIEVYIDNPSYYLKNTYIHADVKKLPTDVTVATANCNETSNIIQVKGNVLNEKGNAHYGRVVIEFPEVGYKHDATSVNYDGIFNTNINLKKIYDIYNNNKNNVLEPYIAADEKDTEITLSGDTEVNLGESFTIDATIKATDQTTVTDGMLVFIVYKKIDNQNIEVYRYATELDDTGVASLFFNTSKQIAYFVQAEYYGMFGYQDSISAEHMIEVK